MSYQGITGWLSIDRVDLSLAKVVVVVSILLLGLSLFASQPLLLVIPLAAGAGGGLYLLTQYNRESEGLSRNDQQQGASVLTLPQAVTGYLPALVMVGLTALVVAVHQVGTRTLPVYLLIGGIGVAIFAQILFTEETRIAPGSVLAQILVAAVVLRFTALYTTPGFVGVDIWTHATVFVEGISREGSLAPLAGDKYVMAPLYHVIASIGALLLGGARNGVYLTVGVLVPLSALFVYGTGRILLPTRWALLATGLYAFSDQFIRWGMHIIPTSLGLVFFLAAVYAITRVLAEDAELWALGLLLVSSLAVVFTHQVSTVITLLLLGVATLVATTAAVLSIGSSPSGGVRKALGLAGVFVFTLVTTLVSWSLTPFSGGSFLWSELDNIRAAIAESAGFLNLVSESDAAASSLSGPVEGGGVVAGLIPYIELVGFALLLLATVLGGLYIFHRKEPVDLTSTHLLTGALLFALTFGLSLFGIRALLPGRWVAFLYVSMALLGATGLYAISRTGSSRVVLALFVIIALGYPTTMVVAEKATLDSPAFETEHERFSFTEPEVAAVKTLSGSSLATSGGTIATDQPYVTLFRRIGGYGYGASVLELGPDGPEGTDAAVYRSYQSTGPVSFDRAATAPGFELRGNVADAVCPAGWNSAYTNSEVTYCTPSSLTEGAG